MIETQIYKVNNKEVARWDQVKISELTKGSLGEIIHDLECNIIHTQICYDQTADGQKQRTAKAIDYLRTFIKWLNPTDLALMFATKEEIADENGSIIPAVNVKVPEDQANSVVFSILAYYEAHLNSVELREELLNDRVERLYKVLEEHYIK